MHAKLSMWHFDANASTESNKQRGQVLCWAKLLHYICCFPVDGCDRRGHSVSRSPSTQIGATCCTCCNAFCLPVYCKQGVVFVQHQCSLWQVSPEGRVLEHLMDSDGSVVNSISAVTEHKGRLFFGNVVGDYVSYIDYRQEQN